MFRFTDLPLEAQSCIVSCLSHEDLANFRRVSRHFCDIATRGYFRKVVLYPNSESPGHFKCIENSSTLSKHVREVVLYTHSQPEQTEQEGCNGPDETKLNYGDWAEEDEDGPYAGGDGDSNDEFLESIRLGYLEGLANLSQFPHLKSINVVFTPDCLGPWRFDSHEVAEDISSRSAKLIKIFGALQTVLPHTLRIKNLQNYPDDEVASCNGFRDTLENLRQLHIESAETVDPHGPDEDIDEAELRTFYPYLLNKWLRPLTTHLTHLTLTHKDGSWGSIPGYFAPHDLRVSVLQYLHLSDYVVGHDDQYDWILSQSSLSEMKLENCRIVCLICIGDDRVEEWKLPTHDWKVRERGDSETIWSYNGTWSNIFDNIRFKLRLTSFTFELHDWRDITYNYCHQHRYCGFSTHWIPQWTEEMDDMRLSDRSSKSIDADEKDRHLKRHFETLEADQAALDGLEESIAARRA